MRDRVTPRWYWMRGFLFVFLLLLVTPSLSLAAGEPPVHRFHALSGEAGWLWQGDALYLTEDRGLHWREITPPSMEDAYLNAPFFLDTQRGWVLSLLSAPDGQPTYRLSMTVDGGRSWETRRLPLFRQDDPNRYAAQLYLEFVDERHGWVVVKRASSSNFSLGVLFRTEDGGKSWVASPIPIAEPVYFISPQRGWVAGGPAGDRLYTTEDGGATWSPLQLAEGVRRVWLPVFSDAYHGVLPLQKDEGVVFYTTQDGGESWRGSPPLAWGEEAPPAYPFPRSVAFSSYTVGEGTLSEVSPVSEAVGWGLSIHHFCREEEEGSLCFREERLLSTKDGGLHWEPIPLPDGEVISLIPLGTFPEAQLRPASGKTSILQGQGFDKCEVATLSQLQRWHDQSPYRAVNLYIGGACRACSNSALSASYLEQMSAQGWLFIPTWVGPQSAGYGGGCSRRISNDTATAYQQGIDEANAAIEVARSLGLTLDDGSGTVIYYDLEGYTNNSTYRNAAKAFISGWSARLRATGNQAGVYGSACASYIDDFASISNVPDVVWPAAWYKDSYYANATIWSVPCVPDSHWVNHQRIRQYAGGHTESWGGVSLNIDCNVMDSVVADLGVDAVPPVTTLDRLEGEEGENGWYRSSVQFQITASDSGGSGFKALHYRINDRDWQTTSNPSLAMGLFANGRFTFQYYAEDNAGNRESVHTLQLNIDTVAPSGSISINGGATTTPRVWVHLRLPATDATSGIAQMRLRNSIYPWASWQPYSEDIPWALPSVQGSSFTVEVQFKDAAGNVSPTYGQSILVDLYPPRPTSLHYHLSRSTWGAAAIHSHSTAYLLNGTLGQPSLIGEANDDDYRLISGFWYTVEERFTLYLPLILKP